jgi:hypothetical protein
VKRDRGFESISLQRGISCEPGRRPGKRSKKLSRRVGYVSRGTEGSNPSPSSRQSVSLPQSFLKVENLAFRADRQFLNDLEEFPTIAHEHLGEPAVSLSIGMSHHAHALVRAQVQSRIYDTCAKCTPTERALAVLDLERVMV